MTAVSRLLKSCAMPPVSWPIASIFCDWRSISSARRRSAMSRSTSTTRKPPSTRPPSAAMPAATNDQRVGVSMLADATARCVDQPENGET